MFLTKNPSGIYQIIYRNRDGKRCSISAKTKFKVEANHFLIQFRKQYFEELANPIIPISLEKFRWNFLKYSESVHTVKTNKAFKVTFKFLLNYFGDIQLNSITTKEIQEYLLERIKRSSIYAARRDHINISSMFTKAVLDGNLLKNPASSIKRIRLPEKQPKYFNRESFNKLLQTINEEDIKDIVIFDINTGLRLAELCSLQWKQFNDEQKLINLDNQTFLTKSKRIRSVPLNDEALRIISKRKESRINDYIFTRFNQPIDPDKLTIRFKKYIRSSGIDTDLHFHSLRHTFASWLVQAGESIFIVSKLLGHQDIKTTMIYSHLTTNELRRATDRLNNKVDIG